MHKQSTEEVAHRSAPAALPSFPSSPRGPRQPRDILCAVGAGAAAGGAVAHLDHLAVRLEISVKERCELGGAHARENRRALVDGVEPPGLPGLSAPRQLALRRRLGAVVHG